MPESDTDRPQLALLQRAFVEATPDQQDAALRILRRRGRRGPIPATTSGGPVLTPRQRDAEYAARLDTATDYQRRQLARLFGVRPGRGRRASSGDLLARHLALLVVSKLSRSRPERAAHAARVLSAQGDEVTDRAVYDTMRRRRPPVGTMIVTCSPTATAVSYHVVCGRKRFRVEPPTLAGAVVAQLHDAAPRATHAVVIPSEIVPVSLRCQLARAVRAVGGAVLDLSDRRAVLARLTYDPEDSAEIERRFAVAKRTLRAQR